MMSVESRLSHQIERKNNACGVKMFSEYYKCCRKLYSYQEDTYPLLTMNDFIHVLAVPFFVHLLCILFFSFTWNRQSYDQRSASKMGEVCAAFHNLINFSVGCHRKTNEALVFKETVVPHC